MLLVYTAPVEFVPWFLMSKSKSRLCTLKNSLKTCPLSKHHWFCFPLGSFQYLLYLNNNHRFAVCFDQSWTVLRILFYWEIPNSFLKFLIVFLVISNIEIFVTIQTFYCIKKLKYLTEHQCFFTNIRTESITNC